MDKVPHAERRRHRGRSELQLRPAGGRHRLDDDGARRRPVRHQLHRADGRGVDNPLRLRGHGRRHRPEHRLDQRDATVRRGTAGRDVRASASDPDGDDLTYTWYFGDGTSAEGASVTHTYENAGSYDAYVEVTDGNATVESDTTTVSAGGAPNVEITSPADGSTFRAGESIDVTANVTDPEDGELSGDAIEWSVRLAHNAHIHPDSTPTGESFTFDVPTTGHPTTGDVGYTISVTATDSDGLQTTESVEIRPEEVDVTLRTEPDGVPVDVEGSPESTDGGYTFDTVIGYEHSLSAPQSVCRQGTTYEFANWSDGDTDRTRTYTVPDADATLTARYEAAGSCEGLPQSGLVGHYEADAGVTTNGSAVTGWTDASGNGNDLDAAGAPQFVAGGADGAAAVAFDGEDDVLRRTGLIGFPAGDENRTMFLVANYTDNGGGFGGAAYGAAASNRAFGLVVDDEGMLTVQGFGGGNDFPADRRGLGAGWLTQSVVYEGGQFTQYANGQQLNSGTHQSDEPEAVRRRRRDNAAALHGDAGVGRPRLRPRPLGDRTATGPELPRGEVRRDRRRERTAPTGRHLGHLHRRAEGRRRDLARDRRRRRRRVERPRGRGTDERDGDEPRERVRDVHHDERERDG
ncbi:PKD domain-containing protein [Halogeometricum sp. CBA1124]|nr:PKD domain-containing protein [Halogeometricum sp. CBA1124]